MPASRAISCAHLENRLPSLLLLEDDPVAAAILGDGLRALGWTVHVEQDGVEALRVLQADPPDAVVADLVLPGLDGLAVCARLRVQSAGSRIPVIVTSARADAEAAALAAGADGFIAKPARAQVVHDMLQAAIGARARTGSVDVVLPPLVLGPESERGAVSAGWLPDLLRRLWREHFTGALEVQTREGLAVRVYLQQGYPAAARSSDVATNFGEILASLGLVERDRVDALVPAPDSLPLGARTLGETLVQRGVLDRISVERALREQVLVRVLGAGRATSGTWRLIPAPTLGFAGFEVHPIAIEWRLGGVSEALPGTGFRAARATAPAFTPELWDHLDPQRTLRRVRGMLGGGAPMSELLAEGAAAERLLGLMYAYGILRLAVESGAVQTEEDPREDALAGLVAEHRLLADASHYAVLGVGPGAGEREIATALDRAARLLDDAARDAVDGASRQRLREIQLRVHDAARVLGDRERRAIYDSRLDGIQLRSGPRGFLPASTALPDDLAEHGRQLLISGHPVTALSVLGTALVTADQDDPEVLALIGRARAMACPGDPAAGEDALRMALRIDPGCELALVYLGERLSARPSDGVEARACLRAALQANPDSVAAGDALRALTRRETERAGKDT